MSEDSPTGKRLTLAFTKLKRDAKRDGKPAPSISAVAREVGVSHTLIHTKYPLLAERIRNESGRGPKQQLKKQLNLVKEADERAADLRKQVASLKTENKGLVSANARFILLVKKLERKVVALESGARVLRPKPQAR